MSGIPAWAVKGAKVVCIEEPPSGAIRRGEVVTIALVTDIRDPHGDWGVVFEEVVSPDGFGGFFKGRRFRPLVTRTQDQDIALFAYLLDSVGEDA